jgi:hypothetical protein
MIFSTVRLKNLHPVVVFKAPMIFKIASSTLILERFTLSGKNLARSQFIDRPLWISISIEGCNGALEIDEIWGTPKESALWLPLLERPPQA